MLAKNKASDSHMIVSQQLKGHKFTYIIISVYILKT